MNHARSFISEQINEFVKLGGDQLYPYYADILGAILPCVSDQEEKIRAVGLFDYCFLLLFDGMVDSVSLFSV